MERARSAGACANVELGTLSVRRVSPSTLLSDYGSDDSSQGVVHLLVLPDAKDAPTRIA